MGIDVVSKTSFRHMFYSSCRLPMRTGGMIIETAKFQIVLVCVMQISRGLRWGQLLVLLVKAR